MCGGVTVPETPCKPTYTKIQNRKRTPAPRMQQAWITWHTRFTADDSIDYQQRLSLFVVGFLKFYFGTGMHVAAGHFCWNFRWAADLLGVSLSQPHGVNHSRQGFYWRADNVRFARPPTSSFFASSSWIPHSSHPFMSLVGCVCVSVCVRAWARVF